MKNRARLLAKMKALAPAIRSAIKQAMAEGADEIVSEQKRLVPVRNGKLRDSIRQTWGDKPSTSAGTLVAGGEMQGDPDLTVWITAGDREAFYARYVEFGTAPHVNGGMFAGTQHPGATQQPFFYPVYRAKRRRVKSRIARAIRQAAREVARKGGS